MGFSGHLIFGRSTQPLLSAPVFDDFHQEVKDTVRTLPPRPGGWQTLQFDSELWEPEYLPALVAWTKAPACVASIYDSEMALITGLDPVGREWDACLNPEIAASLLVEEPQDLDDLSLWFGTPDFDEAIRRKQGELRDAVPASAEGALAWAILAGVPTPPQAAVEELLGSGEVFAERLFATLLDVLGFPEPNDPAPLKP
jgi:hypothetical protein